MRDADRKILDRMLGWLGEPKPRPRPEPEDTLHDIKGIPLDYFWRKCEEFLPDDWGLGLIAVPCQDGSLLYRAEASLIIGFKAAETPGRQSNPRDTPERALEDLFYELRDML